MDQDLGAQRRQLTVACVCCPVNQCLSGHHGASHSAFRASKSHGRYLRPRHLSPGSVFLPPAPADSREEPCSRVTCTGCPGDSAGSSPTPVSALPCPPTLITAAPALSAVSSALSVPRGRCPGPTPPRGPSAQPLPTPVAVSVQTRFETHLPPAWWPSLGVTENSPYVLVCGCVLVTFMCHPSWAEGHSESWLSYP